MCHAFGPIEHHNVLLEVFLLVIYCSEEGHKKRLLLELEVQVSFASCFLVDFQTHNLLYNKGSQSSMRTSRTLPDTNMRKFSKWGSINTDSGISLLYDTRNRDAMSVSSNSTTGSTAKAHRSQMLPPEIIQQAVNKPTHFEDTRRFV